MLALGVFLLPSQMSAAAAGLLQGHRSKLRSSGLYGRHFLTESSPASCVLVGGHYVVCGSGRLEIRVWCWRIPACLFLWGLARMGL